MGKFALLIGVSEYASGLQPLPKAVLDVEKLAQILKNPEIGGFENVDVLKNPDRQDMANQLYQFFRSGQKHDLLLVYFSGHGVVDGEFKFYLSSRSTQKDQEGALIPPTAVAATDIHNWMSSSTCKAQKQVIILDCCNAGAFPKGMTAKTTELTIDIKNQLGGSDLEHQSGGKGRVILTAATSTQYAFEQEGLDLSIYTHYLVEGLEKGAADLDDDGQISVEELHEYVFKTVKEAAPAMTPEIYNLARDTEPILIARSPKDDPVVKYRKEVRKLAEEDEGEFSFINRSYLDEFQRELRLDPPITQTIETEELEPYRQRKAKEARYREVFSGAIQQRYPLTPKDRNGLERLQKLLSLRDEDINRIEQTILHERQLPPPPPTQPATSSPTIITPATEDIPLESEKGIDYSELRDLLKAGEWKKADQETASRMLQAMNKENWWDVESNDLLNFPCKDLKTIDRLWVHYSKGHFGFSVQKKIYVECGGKLDGKYPGNEIWHKFCDRVGWRKDNRYVNYSDLKYNPSISLIGELPACVLGCRVGRTIRPAAGGVSSLAQRLVNCSTSQS